MEEDTNSHVSFELHEFAVVTPSSGDSPPPPYTTSNSNSNSDTTSLGVSSSSFDHGEMMEDSFSITGSTASCSTGLPPSFYGLEDDYDYPEIIPPGIRKVILEKDSRGFGLTVAGGSDSPYGVLPVFVTSLDPNGVAADSGEVRLGDRIVSVNGREIEGKTHAAVVQVIKLAGSRVILELTEGPENIMNYLAFD